MDYEPITTLAERLAHDAEAVCRHYLSNGYRAGRYWQVGDARNTPGRSTYVRLHSTAKGQAGKWTDAATGEHGDLLDIIRECRRLHDFKDVAEEARRFLAMPAAERPEPKTARRAPAPQGSPEAARRLIAISKPITGTIAQAYLRKRGITDLRDTDSLHFHPHCYYRPDETTPTETWPAIVASVTDLAGRITGAHRTWLDRDGRRKAPIDTPRRAMGDLLGNAVRFGFSTDVIAAGEGIETVLSLRQALPRMPTLAGLSAAHLAAIAFPESLRRLYIVRDNDPAGDAARDTLAERANAAGIEAIVLTPELEDYNEDLLILGLPALRARVRQQMSPVDIARYLAS